MSLRIVQSVDSLAERHGGPSRAIVMLAQAQARAGAHVRLIARTESDGGKLYLPDATLAPLTLTTGFADRCRRTAGLLHGDGSALLHETMASGCLPIWPPQPPPEGNGGPM